ncbi:hypothetical protein BKA61DRAFT_733863 [Leptodontidium sp. MPI-SDFR-AT-0119]|nr:hypothetical protein BKA61DRAFT_733863 [Leptodontidium sp. MPI-SDFR-AT-0119]
MANYTFWDDSMFWKISPWGHGTFYFTDGANGTAWHLSVKRNSLMAMTSNITTIQDSQRFSFKQMGTIDNMKYSSIITVSATATVTATATATTTPSGTATNTQTPGPTHRGLSSGAAAGIGVVAILLLAIAGFLIGRRRKARAGATNTQPMPYEPAELQSKFVQDYKPVQELAGAASGAVRGGERRVELPGY